MNTYMTTKKEYIKECFAGNFIKFSCYIRLLIKVYLKVCNDKMKIRYVDDTHPGVCHDSSIRYTSQIRISMEQEYVRATSNVQLLGTILIKSFND